MKEAQDLLVMVKSNWPEVTCNKSTANAWHILLQNVTADDAMRIIMGCVQQDAERAPTPKYILGVVASERRRNGQMFISSSTSGRCGDPGVIKDFMAAARDAICSGGNKSK